MQIRKHQILKPCELKKGDVVYVGELHGNMTVESISFTNEGHAPWRIVVKGRTRTCLFCESDYPFTCVSRANPAVSEKQRKLFGQVVAYKQGRLKGASKKVKEIAKNIALQTAREFAKSIL